MLSSGRLSDRGDRSDGSDLAGAVTGRREPIAVGRPAAEASRTAWTCRCCCSRVTPSTTGAAWSRVPPAIADVGSKGPATVGRPSWGRIPEKRASRAW